MSVTPASIKTFAPEVAGVTDGAISTWIGWAVGAIDATRYLTDTDQAVTLWVCHNLVRQGASGTAGAVTDRKVGDVSVSNASPADATAASLLTTSYGVALQRLMRRYTAGGAVV